MQPFKWRRDVLKHGKHGEQRRQKTKIKEETPGQESCRCCEEPYTGEKSTTQEEEHNTGAQVLHNHGSCEHDQIKK